MGKGTSIIMSFGLNGGTELRTGRGLGRVMKSAWEAQDLEWIDLVLG